MTSDPETERVRGYLLSQSERYDWVALWPRVVGPRAELLSEIARVTEEQAAFKPSPEEWSIRDCVSHLLYASRDALAHIEALANGRSDARAAPETLARSFEDLRTQLTTHSAHFAAVIERLPAVPNLQLTAQSGVFGELNSRAWFLFQRLHDTDHLNQIRAIEAAPGYPSG